VNVAELAWRQAEARGNPALAASVLERLAPLGRDNETARTRLGRGLYDEGDHARARRQFERSLEIAPTANAYGGLARSYEAEGRLEPALQAYAAGLAIDPGNAGLLRRSGFVELRLGRTDRAIGFLERSLEIDPRNQEARDVLERARRRLGS
jgi:tetratricopeptide (TPR) repeat protein